MKEKKIAGIMVTIILVCLLTGCGNKDTLTLKDSKVAAKIDINETTYTSIELPALFTETAEGVKYDVSTDTEHLQLSSIAENGKLNIISDGTTGEYTVQVAVSKEGQELLIFNIAVSVVNLAPDPAVTKDIPALSVEVPVFPGKDGATYYEYSLDLSEYFSNIENAAFEMDCTEESAAMECDQVKPWLVKLIFKEIGDKTVTICATKNGERKAETSFRVNLTGEVPKQLFNGDFENGLTGWDLDEWGLAAYTVIDDPVDIWGNGIDAEGSYLYGFHDESGTCEFTSSLFELDGTGYITWKMSGNCTENLQLILMQYNEDEEDTEIARFNNWYYGVYAASGFIFRNYYYQVDMDRYGGSKCYFIVRDNDTGADGFGFLNLDSIVTYHTEEPELSGMYLAGYINDPSGVEMDFSDTSNVPFPEDLSGIGYQMENGDFENGYTGWYMTEEEKKAYALIGSKTDIWNNPVYATNNYLYGYANESFATANFHSSLFKVGGTGIITWKMAGNCTEGLQFILMKYNPGGKDEEIARFNNWYYEGSNESGFIFRDYYYQIDMDRYEGSYCYFIVKDSDNGSNGFGFVNLDDIVTYYEMAPSIEGMFKAGFRVNPDA